MDEAKFAVIVSTQELYSVWPAGVEAPLGWDIGEVSERTLEECLQYIDYVWRERDVIPTDGFVVIIDDHDILSVTLAKRELPEGWRAATEPATLAECLTFIGEAWLGRGPLPERFRPGTGESAAQEETE